MLTGVSTEVPCHRSEMVSPVVKVVKVNNLSLFGGNWRHDLLPSRAHLCVSFLPLSGLQFASKQFVFRLQHTFPVPCRCMSATSLLRVKRSKRRLDSLSGSPKSAEKLNKRTWSTPAESSLSDMGRSLPFRVPWRRLSHTLARVPYLQPKLGRVQFAQHTSPSAPAVVPTHTSSVGYLRSSQAAGP